MKRTKAPKQANDIFPSQVMENAVYDHFNQYKAQGQFLYLFVLALISICFVSLFFIKVPISVQSGGILTAMSTTSKETSVEFSPDSALIAQVYISPTDIVFIREGMEVVMRIDAYDYNLWGTVDGNVSEISGDVSVDHGTPMFTIRCSLDSQTLMLKNGYTSRLKKGMALQASFLIAERTLFQLLYDKADDWITVQSAMKSLSANQNG